MKVYHHNDADGRCSAAIIKLANPDIIIDFIEIDYKDTIDVQTIKQNESVVIVDFSFTPEVMSKILNRTNDIIWIDHHKTAQNYHYNKILKGIRDFTEPGRAACELTWHYYFPNKTLPEAVALIADKDVWTWKLDNTDVFTEGLKLYDHHPTASIWIELLTQNYAYKSSDNTFIDIIHKGKFCIAYRNSFCKEYKQRYGHSILFEGYQCYVLNLHYFGGIIFKDKLDSNDICISYVYNGNNYTVGLYSKNIDVNIIAQKYHGGGHKHAAGFNCKQLPFNL